MSKLHTSIITMSLQYNVPQILHKIFSEAGEFFSGDEECPSVWEKQKMNLLVTCKVCEGRAKFPLCWFFSVSLWNRRQASYVIKHSSFGLHLGS